MPRILELPPPIMTELRAANAKRMSQWDGPDGRQYQLWLARAGLVMAELHPEGSVYLWQPLAHKVGDSAFFEGDKLRSYLTTP